MPWLQLFLNSTPEEAPKAESIIAGLGALSVTLQDNADQPIFEPALGETPLWEQTRITGLFDASINTQATSQKLNQLLPNTQHRWEQLEDKDWEREWMTHFTPIQCGEQLWICPSWCAPQDPHATNILLDPGLAFGTGTHPTTFLCMKWLAKQDLNNKTVLDYGCGSGILAITAKKLGASYVCGIDIDPQAIIATLDNSQRNGLQESEIDGLLPNQHEAYKPYDIVIANILAGPLVELADILLSHLNPNGQICLSGILESQAETVMSAYEHRISFEPIQTKDQWVVLSGIAHK